MELSPKTSNGIHPIGCETSDPKLSSLLQKISEIPSLASPVVCLPDLYLKARTEAPASIATAVRDKIVPTLSAPSLGCSMGVIATSLTKSDIVEDKTREFIGHMQEELGKWYGFLENIFTWLGLKTRPLKKYDLTMEDFEDFIRHGAKAAVKRYDLPNSILNNLELGGSVYTDQELKNLDLKKILPRSSFTNGRHDLGYGFKGNHFLELHMVEKIMDPASAASWGLKPNQILIFYHGGGGIVPYHVGRYYASRRKNNFKQKFFLAIGKIFFHLFSWDGVRNLRLRLKYYFFPKTFQEIDANSPEGLRYLLAMKAALNYSYAFNVAIIRRVADALAKTFPEKKIETALVSALVHNSIFKEKINGEELFVHRHTLNHVQAGKPIPLAGFNNTVSYLGVGLEAPEKTLRSAEHGAGENIRRFKEEGKSSQTPEYATVIYRSKPPHEQKVFHTSSEGVDFVMQKLEEAKLIRPVLTMRPLASFKG